MKQYHKSVSFPKSINKTNKTKVLKLVFGDKDKKIYEIIKNLSSAQIRKLLDNKSYEDLVNKANNENRSLNQICNLLIKEKIIHYEINNNNQLSLFYAIPSNNLVISKYSATFKNNKEKGIFNWYPYVEGFSYDFIQEILKFLLQKPEFIYDPFAGTGTTVLVSILNNIRAGYSEINPLMKFIIDTKIIAIKNYEKSIKSKTNIILEFLDNLKTENIKRYQLNRNSQYLLDKGFFNENILYELNYIKNEILSSNFNYDIKNVLLLNLASILVKQSNMIRRADLRYKKGNEYKEIEDNTIKLFKIKTYESLKDLDNLRYKKISDVEFISDNAKNIPEKYNKKIDLIITSPPYVNGTNYFRNTKLELLFLDLIKDETHLRILRDNAITSGINNVTNRKNINNTLNYVEKYIKELQNDSYDNRIPKLIKLYFHDMKIVFNNIKRVLTENGEFFIDIGDSKFKNVHIPTDLIFEEIANEIRLELIDKKKIRTRYSKDGFPLGQWILHFKHKKNYIRKNPNNSINNKVILKKVNNPKELLIENWEKFRDNLPYKNLPYRKRNWGNTLHSLCSYQGKLKPAIAHFLIKYFTSEGMIVLDPLSGVGTIPLEASLQKRIPYGNDLSLVAYANTLAKIGNVDISKCENIVYDLEYFIKNNLSDLEEIEKIELSFNKKIQEYYHVNTLREIVAARQYFIKNGIKDANYALVFSSLLHILHGNRPYALSRISHPITPFAPKGEFIYKNLIEKLIQKLSRVLKEIREHDSKVTGNAFLGDFIDLPKKIKSLSIDAIITSPPFFDSTKFYMSNWIRMWFAGWEKDDFYVEKNKFLETKQIKSFDVYNMFFQVCDILLKNNGSIIMHLGFSKKANMAEKLIPYASKYFRIVGYFNENVDNSENFGISDQGTVKSHQYLFLIKE